MKEIIRSSMLHFRMLEHLEHDVGYPDADDYEYECHGVSQL